MPDLCRDRSKDILKSLDGVDVTATMEMETANSVQCRTQRIQLEDDSCPCLMAAQLPTETVAARARAPNPKASGTTGSNSSVHSTAHAEKLFPNSFKVSGIKHICDNALQSILSYLPSSLVLFRATILLV